MTITIADGRGALWQWDTGRRLRVGSGVDQIHYQNRALCDSVDVDVGDDGTAIIPDELLQDCHTLTAYAYVTDDTGAYTMVQQDFIVHKRAKPAGYVYTPTDQMTLQTIQRQIGDLADLTTEAKDTLVAAINEAARTGGGAGSGFTATQIAALDGLLKNAAYTKDVTTEYAAFRAAFGLSGGDEPGTETWSVTSMLTNATSDNSANSVAKGGSYSATITAEKGYTISNVAVTMGGVDITATAYANGVITIASVTGNVTITVEAVTSGGGDQIIANGLMAYFDFRTAEYSNDAAGGTTTISPTSGSGSLFTWAKNSIATQDDHGIHAANSRKYAFDARGGAEASDYTGALTLLVLTKGHVADQGFTYLNYGQRWAFSPVYNTTSKAQTINGTVSKEGYDYCVYRVDGGTLTLKMNDDTATYTGDEISGFESWVATVNIGAQDQTGAGVYLVGAAIYNRALTDIEIEDMRAFFQTLEVSE